MATMLKYSHSADILFSDEEPKQTFSNDDSFYSTCSSSVRNHRLKDSRFSHNSQPWPISCTPKSTDPAAIKGRGDSEHMDIHRMAPIAQSCSASELSGNSHLFADDDSDYSKLTVYKDTNANYKNGGMTTSSGDLYSKSWCGDSFVNGLNKKTQHSEIKEYRPCFSDTEGNVGSQTGRTEFNTNHKKVDYTGNRKYRGSIPTVPAPKYTAGLYSHSSDQFYIPSSYNNDILSSRNSKNPPLSASSTASQQSTGTDTVDDLYMIPHTFNHHRVTRQPVVPPTTANGNKPPPTLSFPPPPPVHRDFPGAGMDKRHTWSPPTFSRAIEAGGSHFSQMRSYRSNDQLDDVMFDVVEEGEEGVAETGPPKLAPVSGKLQQQNAHQSLIKPIAFKPVVILPTTPTAVQPHYGTASRCLTSPRQQQQPLMTGGLQRAQPHSQSEAAPETTPPAHCSSSHSNTPYSAEKMRAKTLSPYEFHSNTLNGSQMTNTSYTSPPQIHTNNNNHHPQHQASTPKIVLYDCKPTTNQSVTSHHDDGYISQDCHSGLHSHSNSSHSNTSHSSHSNTSHGSLHNDSDRSFEQSSAYTNNNNALSSVRPTDERSGSFTVPTVEGGGVATSRAGDVLFGHTPSPSDSGVGELEAMLRDKDAVIQHLRETMEKNETAILQVCAEKEQNWDLELQQAHTDWERRWRQHQQKAFKMEQALLLQLFKLQQERKALRLDIEKSKTDRDSAHTKLTECMDDLKQTKVKLDEVNWDLCQKCGEISLLKSQLKDSKDETVTRKNEIISTKSQLKNYQKTSDQKDHEILTLEADLKRVNEELKGVNGTISSLQQDLDTAKKEVFNAQQKADLKDLQLDMKRKELEKAHSDYNKRTNALKSSSPTPVKATATSPLAAMPQNNDTLPSPHNGGSLFNGIDKVSPKSDGEERDKLSTQSPISNPGEEEDPPKPVDSLALKAELDQLKAEFEKAKAGFSVEREQWLEEKNKVIRYQKHLQLNYVQMYRKNKVLESEVEQLTLDLEKKDLSLMDSQEGGDRYVEGQESMC